MDVAQLVRAASEGDQAAWNAIVDRFSGLLWATARAHRLSPSDGRRSSRRPRLRLVENLDRIREPERVGAWLVTTTRNECLRLIRRGARELATGDESVFDGSSDAPVDLSVLAAERDVALWEAFAGLGRAPARLSSAS